jgi:hypothetical protein
MRILGKDGLAVSVGHSQCVKGVRQPRPNPSIEGTSNSKLRLPLAAPHVKR